MTNVTMLDGEKVRKEFPFFKTKRVYLDTAATAQKPQAVIDAITNTYKKYANVHRGAYELAEELSEKYESARKTIAKFINALPKEIVFVRNATEAINLVARSWGEANISKGDTILLTEMEHHSNLVPWQMLAEKTGAIVKYVPITESGELDWNAAAHELKQKPKLFAFTHISNVLGTVNPAKELIAEAHKYDVPVLLDACQSVPHMLVNVRSLNADFLVFSGHKMYGPEVGVLYAKQHILEEMPPFLGGGDMIKGVTFDGFTTNEVPWKFEAGTPNIAGAIGLAAAVDFLEAIGMEKVWAHEQALVEYALARLKENELVTVYGPEQRAGVMSFNFGDMHAHDVSTVLDHVNVSARSGHHCAQPLMTKLSVPATVRISFGVYTTKEDIDVFLAGLVKAKEVFRL